MTRLVLASGLLAVAAACVLAVPPLVAAPAAPARALPSPLNSVLASRQWLNTPPLRPEDLRGKVVLVNFWTYSCINSLRPLPYVRTWAAKYKDRGLVVIGVHTPEFRFEKDVGNITRANAALGVGYPVAVDSERRIWDAFNNQAWPGFYFIGADGRVRRQKLGEGGYAESERLLQQLLSEARRAPVTDRITPVVGRGPEAAPDDRNLRSPETYVGYAQAADFASPGGLKFDVRSVYQTRPAVPINHWSLAGAWTVGSEFATSNTASAAISYRFHARDLHLVMGPGARNRPIRFKVTIDGAPPGADHGFDVDAAGRGTLQEPRMYQLVRQARPVADRTFKIEFLDPGARAYVFTFG